MTLTTRLGLVLLPTALGIGALGDWLLRATPWGVNVFLWLLAGLAALGLLARREQIAALGEGVWLGIPVLILSLGLAWRDSMTLKTLDICGLLVCLAVGAARTREGQLRLAGFFDYLADLFRTTLQAAFGVFLLLLRDVEWSAVPRTGWLPRLIAVGRGLLLALPLLLLFGGLLMAADAVYSHLLGTLLHIDAEALFSHLLLTGFLAWLTAGFGRALLMTAPGRPKEAEELTIISRLRPSLGWVETATILGMLNLLFLSFVLVQLRYFFGGAATLQATVGLTYAQYARSGFFELVWVAALVLPILLGLHWLQKPSDVRALRLFSWQAGVQVVLLFVIMASALARMRLYQSEYGLTELRLYTTAFMGWLAVVFVWFAFTVLRGQRERFAFGAAAAAFGWIVVLHLADPDAVIVRANLVQAQKGRAFDADYAVSLSADAIPLLVSALPILPPPAQGTIAGVLVPQWSHDPNDWRSWNWGRARAFEAVQSHLVALQTAQKLTPSAP